MQTGQPDKHHYSSCLGRRIQMRAGYTQADTVHGRWLMPYGVDVVVDADAGAGLAAGAGLGLVLGDEAADDGTSL